MGDDHPLSVDVRIITATNKSLEELIAQKKFRDALFFRINVFPIHLPPLRELSEDIPLLVKTFIRRLLLRTGKKISGLSSAARECFMKYRWPGNVRELKSALEYTFVIAEKGLIDLDQLPSNIVDPKPILQQCKGNQTQTARALGINRVTVWNRMKKYGIDLKKVLRSK